MAHSVRFSAVLLSMACVACAADRFSAALDSADAGAKPALDVTSTDAEETEAPADDEPPPPAASMAVDPTSTILDDPPADEADAGPQEQAEVADASAGLQDSQAPRPNASTGKDTGQVRVEAGRDDAGCAQCEGSLAEADSGPPVDAGPPLDAAFGGQTPAQEAGPPLPVPCDGGLTFDPGVGHCVMTRCLSVEVDGPDGCYYFSNEQADWDRARELCQGRGEGWDLAKVPSLEVHQFMVDHLVVTAETWIGASDIQQEDTWVWVRDETPFFQGKEGGNAIDDAFQGWAGDEPSGGVDEHCARYIERPAGMRWADTECYNPFLFVCQGPIRH